MENKEASIDKTGNRHTPFPSKDLAYLWRIPFPDKDEPYKVEIALHERIKELNCLYGISKLTKRNLYSLDGFLKELVDFLPHSWQ